MHAAKPSTKRFYQHGRAGPTVPQNCDGSVFRRRQFHGAAIAGFLSGAPRLDAPDSGYDPGTRNNVMDCPGKVAVMVLGPPLAGGVMLTAGCDTMAFRFALLYW